jgi:CRP-like cAMP-binding protein
MNKTQNRLLAALPVRSFERLSEQLERIELTFKQLLLEPEQPIEQIYFLERGVCSIVMTAENGAVVEIATVGREGFIGTPVLLSTDLAAETTLCQIPGGALRMSAAQFRDALTVDPALQRICLRYTQGLISQISMSAACNRLHNIEERAARWLLMTHDRVDGDSFPLTQEFLSQMLGVRRQAVNVAAGMLQQAGLITYSQGVVTVVDRAGLEGTSCECYGMIRQIYDRLALG